MGYGLKVEQAERLIAKGRDFCDFFEHVVMGVFLKEGVIPPDHDMRHCYLCLRGEF